MNSSPMQAARPESVISAFVAEYSTKRTFYEKTAIKAAKICEAALNREGIGHKETEHRAKEIVSLTKKLHGRVQKGHQYQTIDDIKSDITDICAARIILDSWMDEKKVKNILHQKFEVVKIKHLPDTIITRKEAGESELYRKKFSSYVATHYLVRLKSGYLSKDPDVREAETGIIEIQVKDFVHHAHAVQEHSAYKLDSAPDPEEEIVFDFWMGAAELFELSEKQARDMIAQKEAPFNTIDEVGVYLDKFISKRAAGWVKNAPRGNSWTPLWAFLNAFSKMNTHRLLEELLVGIFDAESESLFSRMSASYEPATVTLNIFIMDRILLGDCGKLRQVLGAPQHRDSHEYKILTMRNTIMWLDKTFVPRMTWTCIFGECGHQESLLQSLTWLNCPKQKRFLSDQPLTVSDISKMNFLWSWLEEHDVRHIRLAFTMAKIGMQRRHDQPDKAFEGLLHSLEEI
ncbi:RelA/SpoT [Penicillium sp. IBT 35674x]|nr:RelA/SpoT [Penicillium sp. IBT 35674x]